MPQIFQALKCYKCATFQVHQCKKSPKWQCKICGEKQTVKKRFGFGTAADVRKHVQKLNSIRGEIDDSNKVSDVETDEEVDNSKLNRPITKVNEGRSKWSEYVDPEECNEVTSEEDIILLELPTKRRKLFNKRKNYKLQMKNNKCSSDENEDTEQSIDKGHDNFEFLEDDKPKIEKFTVLKESQNNSVIASRSQIKTVSKFVPPALKNNSKWMEFLCDDICEESLPESKNNFTIDYPNSYCVSNTQAKTEEIVRKQDKTNELFSVCEDSNFTLDHPKSENMSNTQLQTQVAIPRVQNQPKALFSLCDDTDLDDILDI